MGRLSQLRPAVWPWIIVLFCVVLAAGCQDGSGPRLITSPEGKPAHEGVKPPPTPPPAADPAIAILDDVRGYSYLKVMNTDGSNLTTILRCQNSVKGIAMWRPSWSPEGGRIAFVRPPGELWLIDVSVVDGVPTGSNVRMLVSRTADRIVDAVAWLPDGEEILFGRSYNLRVPSSPSFVSCGFEPRGHTA